MPPWPIPRRPWQLYDLAHDWSQTTDVAAAHPEKVAELKALWEAEARATMSCRCFQQYGHLCCRAPGQSPASEPGRHVLYPSSERWPEGVFPAINNRSWQIEAAVDVPAGGAEGMLVTQGGRFSGWGLALLGGKPSFLYRTNDSDETLTRLTASQPLAPGPHKVRIAFTVDGPGFGKGGALALSVDGAEVASGRLARTVPFKFSPEDATIGRDAGTALTGDYSLPFQFTGRIDHVTFDLGPVRPMKMTGRHQIASAQATRRKGPRPVVPKGWQVASASSWRGGSPGMAKRFQRTVWKPVTR